jgi:hypothetical protein
MNERFRLPIAVLVSLLLHMAVLEWAMQFVNARVPDGQGLLQVFLQNNAPAQEGALKLPDSSATIKKTESTPVRKPVSLPVLPQSVGGGHFRVQPPPAYQQGELMNAMHLAQLAQEREMQRSAVIAGLSNLAAQLRPAVESKIVCVQQANFEIDCSPEPKEEIRPLLEQFFSMAMEARRLGVAGNPVQLDFGREAGVTITLSH